jgi:uncharacterized protein YijF (DUF1287 family)
VLSVTTLAAGVLLATKVAHAPGTAVRLPTLFGEDPLAPIPNPRTAAERTVNGAKAEARRGVFYDASYCTIAYPGGDVPPDRGACTDVVVRSLRAAGHDLQRLIHEDMRRNFRRYPQRYGLSAPDANIDHRRTPNHITFFRRHGLDLTTRTAGDAAKEWKPGDIVYWKLPSGMGHCGVLSNVRGRHGLPMVIHNMGVTRQEDVLAAWEITDHFRYPPAARRRG